MRSALLAGLAFVTLVAAAPVPLEAAGTAEPKRFQPLDVFELECATDPQISPDGSASSTCATAWTS